MTASQDQMAQMLTLLQQQMAQLTALQSENAELRVSNAQAAQPNKTKTT